MLKGDQLARQGARLLKFPHREKRIIRTTRRILERTKRGSKAERAETFNLGKSRAYKQFMEKKLAKRAAGDRHWWK